MADLKDRDKRFIVERLACHASPSEIVEELKRDFKVDSSIGQVMYYDPTSAQSKGLAREWVELFNKIRTKYSTAHEEHPMWKENFLLDQLLKALRSRAARNPENVVKLVETAAKLKGDFYTNKRDITSGGKSLFDGVSDADLIARAKAALGGVISSGADSESS